MRYEEPKADRALAGEVVGRQANAVTLGRKGLLEVDWFKGMGPGAERTNAEGLPGGIASSLPSGVVRSRWPGCCFGDESFVNLSIDLIRWQLVEDLELLGLEILGRSAVDGGVVVFEVVVEPAEFVGV